jgi:DNA modification methylase
MEKGNRDLYEVLSLPRSSQVALPAKVYQRDARTGRQDDVDLVVTSPPYCTSYNYAELHQLSAFWLGRVTTLASWSNRFIGSVPGGRYERDSLPDDATLALDKLARRDEERAARLSRYWQDMRSAYKRVFESLRPRGVACIVIGDTRHRGISIPNVAVTRALLSMIGFRVEGEILRTVANKSLPQSRNPRTGRFVGSGPCRASYATESILVARKPAWTKRGASQ